MLRFVLSSMPFIGFVMVTTCIFRSTGKASGALMLSAGRQGYIYALVIFMLASILGYKGVIATHVIADVITALLAFFLMKKMLGDVLKS